MPFSQIWLGYNLDVHHQHLKSSHTMVDTFGENMAQAVFPLLFGLFIHLGLFIHGEWHLQIQSLVIAHTLGFWALAAWRYHSIPGDVIQAVFEASVSFSAYLVGLFGSITVYRLFFHRLRAFPGPRLAALSKLWHVWKCRDSLGHHVLETWHQQYGTIVRTGPNELTLFHPDAFEILDGPKNRNTRSEWFDLIHPRKSSIFTRDKIQWKERRRLWEQALVPSTVAEYHQIFTKKLQILEQILSENGSQPLLINELIYWYTFDCMGEFGYGIDFGMLKNRIPLDGYQHMRAAIGLLGPFSPAIWIVRLAFAFLPWTKQVRQWFKMLKFSDECMDVCLKRPLDFEKNPRYIASAFVDSYRRGKPGDLSENLLSGESANMMVAASDSTSPSIIFLLYFLARYPQHAARIQEELNGVNIDDVKALSALPHLTGTINESLRLLPSVPTLVSRITPPKGIQLGNTFIPGGTKICAPRYSIGRLEDAFENAQDFIPERWYSRPHLVKVPRAFAPFGHGPTICVGRNLALAQMRLVAASILSRYHIRFAPGSRDGEAVVRDFVDHLTAGPGSLMLVLEKRRG